MITAPNEKEETIGDGGMGRGGQDRDVKWMMMMKKSNSNNLTFSTLSSWFQRF